MLGRLCTAHRAALALVGATDSIALKRRIARALAPEADHRPMLTPSSSRETSGRHFTVDGVDVHTRPPNRLMLADPDATHEWLAMEDALDLREWS
jgi:hypothetical protein